MSYIPQPYAPLPLAPMSGGLGGLTTGGATGLLGRASTVLPQAAQYAPLASSVPSFIPGGGGGMAPGISSQLAGSVGQTALAEANALRGAAQYVPRHFTQAASTGGKHFAASAAANAGSVGGRGLDFASQFKPSQFKPAWGAASTGAKFGAAGSLLTGLQASKLIDQYLPNAIGGHNSNAEQGLQGAAITAGVVGAAFLLGAPITLPAAAAALAAGGALGVLSNFFGGDDKEDKLSPEEVMANAMTAAQLDGDTREQISVYYDTQMALAEQYEDKGQREDAEAAALEAVSQLVLQAVGTREQASTNAGNVLALQSQAQRIFEPIAQSSIDSANLYAQEMRGLTGSLPPQYAGLLEKQASDATYGGAKLADAYRAQAAVAPMINALTQYQRDNNAYAAQMFQQSMAQNGAQQGPTTNDVAAMLQAP